MFYAIARPITKDSRVLCELPDREWLHSGDYVVFVNQQGQERIAVLLTPDFEDDAENAPRYWGNPVGKIVAKLNRRDIDWPEEDVMDISVEMPEIEE